MSPLYDYQCENCGYLFEAIGREDRLYKDCPNCKDGLGRKVWLKMPLRSYTKRPQDRLWGTAHWKSDKKKGEKK